MIVILVFEVLYQENLVDGMIVREDWSQASLLCHHHLQVIFIMPVNFVEEGFLLTRFIYLYQEYFLVILQLILAIVSLKLEVLNILSL